MSRYVDFPLLFTDDPQTAYAIGSGQEYGPFYVGDYRYLHIWMDSASAVDGPVGLSLLWNLGENPGAGILSQFEELTYWVTASGGNAYYCIPVRAPYVNLTVESTAGVPVYNIVAKLSDVKGSPCGNYIINGTSPGAIAGVITDFYSIRSVIGKARCTGYLFNANAGAVAIVVLTEIGVNGGLTQIMYHQTPPGAVANFVENFDFTIPLSGKALRFRTTRTGAGVMNSFMNIQPYSDEGV